MKILTDTIQNGETAKEALRDAIDHLPTDSIKAIAVQAYKVASPISAFTFARCMEVLAARFDKRSFVNICEAIQRDIQG